jgi:hypothetical protein
VQWLPIFQTTDKTLSAEYRLTILNPINMESSLYLITAGAFMGWTIDRQHTVFRNFLLGIVAWTLFISVVSATGFFQDFSSFPPRIMIVLGFPLAAVILITFSGTMKELLPHVSARAITRLQFFRVFVEILLWMLFIQHILPVQMTFEGRNFDVLAGITAPIIGHYFSHNKKVRLIWNLVSLGLLINIITIAILSLPTPFRVFMNEPANTIVGDFPFIWLPGLLVPLAYSLHFLSLRQLALEK